MCSYLCLGQAWGGWSGRSEKAVVWGELDATDSCGEPSQASMRTRSRRIYCARVLKRVRPDHWSGFLLSESVYSNASEWNNSVANTYAILHESVPYRSRNRSNLARPISWPAKPELGRCRYSMWGQKTRKEAADSGSLYGVWKYTTCGLRTRQPWDPTVPMNTEDFRQAQLPM